MQFPPRFPRIPLCWVVILCVAAVPRPGAAEDEGGAKAAFARKAGDYGRKLARTLADGRLDLFRKSFDQDGFLERVSDDLLLNAEDRAMLAKSLTADAIWQEVVVALKQGGGSLRFVGLRRRDGRDVALLRLTALPNVTAWFGVEVREDDRGRIRTSDVYNYGGAIWRTAQVRHEIISSVPEVDPSPDPLRVEHRAAYTKVLHLFLRGLFDAGENGWKKLPEALRHERFLMRGRLNAARVHSKPAYARAIRYYREVFPDDPYIALREKDLAYMEERWEDMLEHIEAVDAYLGGDPYLGSERAAALIALGRFAEAGTALDEALRVVGPLQELLVMRLLVALSTKDFEKAAEMGRAWEEAMGRKLKLKPTVLNYDAFRASEAYRRWRGDARAPVKSADFRGSKLAFAQALEKELIAGKLDLLLGSWSMDAMADQVLAGMKLTDAEKAAARRSITTHPDLPKITRQVMQMILGEGGRFHLLGVRTFLGRPTAFYRVAGHGLMLWIAFHLVEGPGGTLRIADLYNLASSSWFSDHMRREVEFRHPHATGEDAGNMRAFNATYGKMVSAFGALRYDEGMRLFRTLPETWRRRRHILEVRLHAARQAGSEAYQEALAALLKHHPDDAGAQIKRITFELMRGRLDAARAAIDRLDEVIGGDPILELRRAEVHVRGGRTAQARALAEAFLKSEPPLSDAYIVLGECAVAEGDFKQAVRHYGRAQSMRANPVVPSTQVPRGAEFLAAKEYKRWQARLELLQDD